MVGKLLFGRLRFGGGALRLSGLGHVGLPHFGLLPLPVVGKKLGAAAAVQAEHHGRDAIEQVAVVGDQHQGAGEIGEAVFEDFEGGNVEVVGGLVEQQDVGGLQHEAGDQDARLLAAGEAGHGTVQLPGIEEKTLGPSGDVDGPVLEDDGIAVSAEPLSERLLAIQLFARLIEVDDAQRAGAFHGAGIHGDLAGENAQQRGLAGAVQAQQSQARARRQREAQVAKQGAPAEFLRDILHREQALGAAIGGGEIDLRDAFGGAHFQIAEFAHEAAGVIDARFGFSGPRLGPAAQPLHFPLHAVGERFLAVGLAQQEFFFLLQELAVAALDAKEAAGVGAVDLRYVVDHGVEEVAVVADHDAGERGGGEELFEPLDAFEIQVVGGLIEEQHVGRLGDLAGDGEAALPAAGEGFGAHGGVGEAGAAEGLADEGGALHLVEMLPGNSGGDDLMHGLAFGELGLLRHVADARIAAERNRAAIGSDLTGEDAQQGGFTGAIAADQPEALAFGDAQRDVLKEEP